MPQYERRVVYRTPDLIIIMNPVYRSLQTPGPPCLLTFAKKGLSNIESVVYSLYLLWYPISRENENRISTRD